MYGNTFAHLPPLSTVDVRLQLAHLVEKGWVPILEYKEEEFWHLWLLPNNKKPEVSWLMEQVELCKNQNPHAVVRLSGYNPHKQLIDLRIVVQHEF